MNFNTDSTKPAREIVLSRKKKKSHYLPITFNNLPIIRVQSHKHSGLILDSKLDLHEDICSIFF